MDKEEGLLSIKANDIYDAARDARQSTQGWLCRLRVLEKNLCGALDIERTAPRQISVLKDMSKSTNIMKDAYGNLIKGTEAQMTGMEEASNNSYYLVAIHGVCSLGKLCEAILAILPGTEAASEFLSGTKTVLSASKDFIEGKRAQDGKDGVAATGKALEGSLKLLGEKTSALADLIGGTFDMKILSDPNKKDGIDYQQLAEKAASVVKTLKGLMKTLEEVINTLKHQTRGSNRLGAAAKLLDVLENLLECYKNAVAAYDSYQQMMKTAEDMGRTSAHLSRLKRDYLGQSYGSRKAFEQAIFLASAGNDDALKTVRIKFANQINSEAEAIKWAEELSDALASFRHDLTRAQGKVQTYGKEYGTLLEKLATSRNRLKTHRAKLEVLQQEIADFGAKRNNNYGLLSHMIHHLRIELPKIDETLHLADIRLAITVKMSETRARKKAA
ncbi:hypothetical protein SAMN06265374_1629 [Roseibium denhamense]|uniref:Uncharacterized protein n=2 Tax=Roseibium denhamense TaxID=76305 RepID=A0ABY1NQX3_9HYPH|nr:hypothetical protein SAMN06265374_1629 [Roseibium denhamense]